MESVKIDVRGSDDAAMAVIKPAIGEELGPVSIGFDYSAGSISRSIIVGVSLSLQGADYKKIRRGVKVSDAGIVDIQKLRKKLEELRAMIPKVEAEKAARKARVLQESENRTATHAKLKQLGIHVGYRDINGDGTIDAQFKKLTPEQYIAIMKIVREE